MSFHRHEWDILVPHMMTYLWLMKWHTTGSKDFLFDSNPLGGSAVSTFSEFWMIPANVNLFLEIGYEQDSMIQTNENCAFSVVSSWLVKDHLATLDSLFKTGYQALKWGEGKYLIGILIFFILKSMLRPHQNGSKSKFERNIIGSKVNEPVGYKSWQTFTHRLRNVTANISLPQLPQDQAYPTGSKGYGPTDYKGYFSIMWWKRLKIPGGTIIFNFHRQWLRNSHEPLGFLHLSVKGLTLPQSPNKGIGCDQRR